MHGVLKPINHKNTVRGEDPKIHKFKDHPFGPFCGTGLNPLKSRALTLAINARRHSTRGYLADKPVPLQFAVAMFEFFARSTRAGLIASRIAPSGAIIFIESTQRCRRDIR